MRTLLGAVAGALAMGAVLVSYNLGGRHAFSRDMMAPATQMVMGPDGVARPYLVQAADSPYGQSPYGAAYGWSPYAPYAMAAPAAVVPYGAYPTPRPQYAAERVVTEQPVVRRASAQRAEPSSPRRSWQKSALLIGGSAGAGAGVGALIGGKKGALAGAAIGGGTAAIYDQVKRH